VAKVESTVNLFLLLLYPISYVLQDFGFEFDRHVFVSVCFSADFMMKAAGMLCSGLYLNYQAK
jgi:hypothetical protein